MALQNSAAPITEDVPIPVLFLTGVVIEVSRFAASLVGLVNLPDLCDNGGERRVVARLAMPIDVARKLRGDLNCLLAEQDEPRGRQWINLVDEPELAAAE